MVINVGALKAGDDALGRGRHPRRGRGRKGQARVKVDHRGGAADRRREGPRVRAGLGGRRRVREDVHGVRPGRGDRRGRRADAADGRPGHGGQGGRRHPDPGAGRGDDPGRSQPAGNLRLDSHRARGLESGVARAGDRGDRASGRERMTAQWTSDCRRDRVARRGGGGLQQGADPPAAESRRRAR